MEMSTLTFRLHGLPLPGRDTTALECELEGEEWVFLVCLFTYVFFVCLHIFIFLKNMFLDSCSLSCGSLVSILLFVSFLIS